MQAVISAPKTRRAPELVSTPVEPIVPYSDRVEMSARTRLWEEANYDESVITQAKFATYSAIEIRQLSHCNVNVPEFSGTRSVNDPKMGVIENDRICATCNKDNLNCPGHPGHIELNQMIYHPLFFSHLLSVLQVICHSSGNLLLDETTLRESNLFRYTGLARLNELVKMSEGAQCQCPEVPGTLRCVPNQKIRISESKNMTPPQIVLSMPNVKGSKNSATEIKPIDKVYRILDLISDKSAEIMGFSNGSHPRNWIMQNMIVVPPTTRPPKYINGTVNPDDLTKMYIDIIKTNNKLADPNLSDADQFKTYTLLNDYITNFINNKEGRYGPSQNPYASIAKRLQGKEGMVRQLMMGKRVNYSGRTVVSPDPSLRFGQIRIPRAWASTLTFPEMVTNFNHQHLTNLLREGRVNYIKHGPNSYVKRFIGQRIKVRENQRDKIILTVGDVVERWLQDGDFVLYNRQPTLHKYSMMGYEVVLGDQLTIGHHLSVTTPHNMDFDGDEGNIHVPQSYEVLAELKYVANVKYCILNEQTNRPIIGIVYDALTGFYLMTQSDTRIDREDWNDLLLMLENTELYFNGDFQSRLDKYKVPAYSGAAMFSMLLPADFYYKKGEVEIREGILLRGVITKDHIGVVNNSIIQHLYLGYGPDRTAQFLTEAPWIANKYLRIRGFSVGLKDCIPNDPALTQKIKDEIARSKTVIAGFGPKLENEIEEVQREKNIIEAIQNAQNNNLRLIKSDFQRENNLFVMSDMGGGAKGATLNISQINSMVGQQNLHGKRLALELSNGSRVLPYAPKDGEDIEDRGFVGNSFLAGLDPGEYFHIMMAGREGLLDTAAGTVDTGFTSRRLIKALENMVVAFDGSVRNRGGRVIQFVYGSDHLAGDKLETVSSRTGSLATFINVKNLASQLNVEAGFEPSN